jgi:pyruvate dehydrogenase E2 component (dihydrolipoamide acetyltransferase)
MSSHTFELPDLGEGLTEAEIVRWLVAEGDVVAVDQPVAEVETAKAVVEVPSPYAGRVATLHAAEGKTLGVGAPLITVEAAVPAPDAEVYREEEQAGSGNVLIGYGTTARTGPVRRRHPRNRRPEAPVAATTTAAATAAAAATAPRVVSPLVRRLARDGGLDLGSVTGTGQGGIISRGDVERALAAPAARPVASAEPVGTGERRTPLTGFRKSVAAVLTRSRAEIPEATIWVDADATALWRLRDSTRATGGPGLLAYVARFTVAALRRYPVFNARLDTERQEIVELTAINLGVAVQSDRGLVVPAVLGAESLTTTELDRAIGELATRAREGRATTQELTAGTFTLNNYGAFRVDGSAAIINHPQVAILGLGRIIDRPWVVDGAVTVRKIAQLSFVFDHRVCDGGTAAGFVRLVADAIENPASALAHL